MKKLELTLTALKVPLDAAMIVLAGLTAYWIRVSPFVARRLPVRFTIDLQELTRVVLVVALLWLVVFAVNRLYSTRRLSAREELGRVFYGISTGMMLVFTVIFFIRELFESRFIVLAGWALAIVYVSAARLFLRVAERGLVSHGYGAHRIVMIGSEATHAALAQEFHDKPGLGFHVVGSRPQFTSETQSWIVREHHRRGVDELILTDPDARRQDALRMMAFCEQYHITFMYTADLLETATSRLRAHTFAGIPVFEVQRTPLDGWGRIFKRAFDIVGALILIIATLPLQVIVLVALALERQGGILFATLPSGRAVERVGEGGRTFRYFKFRSMVKDAHTLRFDRDFIAAHGNEREGTPLFKLKDDPRVTPFGRVIRRYSIDEIPEFYLVLLGRMSLVGPRPHLPEEVRQYKPEHRKVMTVKPGITGMAQISGRADLDFEEEVRLDTYYIEHWNPMLDVYILFKTPWIVLTARGAK